MDWLIYRLQKQLETKGGDGIKRIMCEMHVGKRMVRVEEEKEDEEAVRLQHALEQCSLMIGMHPDEATDAIADVAYEYGKPFAIVPCCVFAREFEHRRTPNGGLVETYEDLVEYLSAKPTMESTGVLKHFLPFKGRNQVLYSLSRTQEK